MHPALAAAIETFALGTLRIALGMGGAASAVGIVLALASDTSASWLLEGALLVAVFTAGALAPRKAAAVLTATGRVAALAFSLWGWSQSITPSVTRTVLSALLSLLLLPLSRLLGGLRPRWRSRSAAGAWGC